MLPVISCDAVWIEHYQYLLYLMLRVSLWKIVQDFKRVWKVAIQASLWLDPCISLHFACEVSVLAYRKNLQNKEIRTRIDSDLMEKNMFFPHIDVWGFCF